MITCGCGRSTWRPDTQTWLFHCTLTDQEIILLVGQHCPSADCGAKLGNGEPSVPRSFLEDGYKTLKLVSRFICTLREWNRLQRGRDVSELFDVVEALLGVPIDGLTSAKSLLSRISPTDHIVQSLTIAKRVLEEKAAERDKPS